MGPSQRRAEEADADHGQHRLGPAGRLIAELLDVARIDTGRLQLYRRELELVPLVERVVDSARTSTSARSSTACTPTRAQ